MQDHNFSAINKIFKNDIAGVSNKKTQEPSLIKGTSEENKDRVIVETKCD